MAKGDDKRVRTAIDQDTNRTNTQGNQMYNQFQDQYNNARRQDDRVYNGVTDNLLNYKPVYNANDYLAASGYGGSGGGGSDGGAGGTAVSIARGIDPSFFNVRGGIDQGNIDRMGREGQAGYREMSKGLGQKFWDDYGSYDQGLKSAQAGFQDFANTGGFSQSGLDAIRERSVAPTRAIYEQGQSQMTRQANATGNQNTAAARARMMRDSNSAISDATTANEANMAGLVQQGRLAGNQGLAQVAKSGMDARTAVETMDQNMRAQGLAGMTDIEKSRMMAELENAGLNQGADTANLQGRLQNQGLIQSGDIAAAQMAESAAGRSASAGAASRSDALREAMWRAGLDQTGNDQFLTGQNTLAGLYGTTPASTALANNSMLNLYGQQNNANQGLIGQRMQGAQLPGTFQSAMGNIGSGLNMVGRVGSAIGTMGGSELASSFGRGMRVPPEYEGIYG